MRSVSTSSAHYELRPFHRVHAPLVAGWIRSDDELFWLAPQTPPPITPRKVINWTARHGRPMLFCASSALEPIGYAELNDLTRRSGEFWIGHFIIAPEWRGAGLSRHMMRLLLAEAFGPLGAGRVALIVFPDNAPAVRCYRSAGLVAAGWQDKTFVAREGVHRMLEMALDRTGYEAQARQADSPK